ncbi:hypothetical protein HF086_016277 [Spodoptera exigua]|uniref:CRAL-TRIO domain-containing protein n=1 Tax=Spodoptera exigua TaxID=7107 RepID=A0A922SGN2_SPOEX|nr:hypothetical protein HF086_016277 [Spodoptera exigua]
MDSVESSLLNVTPAVIHNVRKLYGLDDQRRLDEAIKILEDWIEKQPHIVKKDFVKTCLYSINMWLGVQNENKRSLYTRQTNKNLLNCPLPYLKGYGGRFNSLHIITESKAVEILVSTVKQLISEKLGKRIQVHKNLEELYEVVPKDLLPEEYGGKLKSYYKMQAELVEELSSEKHIEYLKIMSKACTDESKRNTEKFNEEYMGMPGTFRNLTVD